MNFDTQQASQLVMKVQVHLTDAKLSAPWLAQLRSGFVQSAMEFMVSNSIAVVFRLTFRLRFSQVLRATWVLSGFSTLVPIYPHGICRSVIGGADSDQEVRSPTVSCSWLESFFFPPCRRMTKNYLSVNTLFSMKEIHGEGSHCLGPLTQKLLSLVFTFLNSFRSPPPLECIWFK